MSSVLIIFLILAGIALLQLIWNALHLLLILAKDVVRTLLGLFGIGDGS